MVPINPVPNTQVPQLTTTTSQSQPIPSGSNVGVDVPIIDISKMTQPQMDEKYPKNKIWNIICPQIRKTKY